MKKFIKNKILIYWQFNFCLPLTFLLWNNTKWCTSLEIEHFIVLKDNDKTVLLFVYWVWVIFGDNDLSFVEKFNAFEIDSYNLIYEKYFYTYSSDFKILQDKFYLHLNNDEIKIAVWYALSQSIKLNYFEDEIYKEINKTSFIPQDIAKYGTTRLKSSDLSKLRWEVFVAKSLLNLQYEFLDEPEYFWDYPEYLKIYVKTKSYLDIPNRIEVLNKKMDVLEELFDVLSDELKHKHEAFLEWIIIVLIVIEIIISVFHEILKFF